MDREHWFDAFNRAVIHTSPRRSILRAAVALSASSILGMGAGSGAEAKGLGCLTNNRSRSAIRPAVQIGHLADARARPTP
jgi:hypothetical protein